MSWILLTETDLFTRLSPQEQATLANIQGATDQAPTYLADAGAALVGSCRAGGYAVNSDGSIPGQYKNEVLALARWEWLNAFPQLKALQTAARQKAFENAKKVFDEIAAQKRNVEPPTAGANPASGQWNSENKLVMRTHPVPPPGTQFQSSDPGDQPEYANPNAPADQTSTDPNP
jgi:hypothetical protein